MLVTFPMKSLPACKTQINIILFLKNAFSQTLFDLVVLLLLTLYIELADSEILIKLLLVYDSNSLNAMKSAPSLFALDFLWKKL